MNLCHIFAFFYYYCLIYKYSNHLILSHPHCKYFPVEVRTSLMYILIMNTALFEETL
jgi:hypothetical protein